MNDKAVFVGTNSHVVAIDKNTGSTIWDTKLKSGLSVSFVSLLVEAEKIFAHTGGELFCLDAATGKVLWKNGLSGLGYELASIATSTQTSTGSSLVAEHERKQREASSSTIHTS